MASYIQSMSGVRKVTRLLAGLPKEARAELAKANEKSARELVAAIRRYAPEDQGDLKKTVTATKGGIDGAGDPDISWAISAGGAENGEKVGYAKLVEFGTRKSAAQPFFFPVYRALRKKIQSRAARAVRNGYKRAAGA